VQNAEAHLQQLSAVPSTFLPGLLEVARTHDQQQFRQMAAVLLRRNVNPDSWAKTSPEAQTAVKTGLLEGLSNESVALVRRAFADATSKLAAVVCAGGAWNELLPFVFNLCVAEDAGRKQSGLELLSALGEEVGESLAIPALEPMLPMLQQSLAPPSALPVRVAALRAVGTLVPHVQGKEHKALNASAQAPPAPPRSAPSSAQTLVGPNAQRLTRRAVRNARRGCSPACLMCCRARCPRAPTTRRGRRFRRSSTSPPRAAHSFARTPTRSSPRPSRFPPLRPWTNRHRPRHPGPAVGPQHCELAAVSGGRRARLTQ